MIRRLAKAMAPSPAEIRRLAVRETDPRQAEGFRPITLGPIVALLLLLSVGIAALVAAPFRLLGSRGRLAGTDPTPPPDPTVTPDRSARGAP